MGRSHDIQCEKCATWFSPFDFATCPCGRTYGSVAAEDIAAECARYRETLEEISDTFPGPLEIAGNLARAALSEERP